MPVFLFSDIESSTRLWGDYPGEMASVIGRHDDLLRGIVARFGGVVVKHTGDGIFAVFNGGDPLACALEIQKAVAQTEWGAIGELRVRLALHVGEAQVRDDDYFGLEVSRTARLLSVGWGGQILLTCEMARAATLPPQATLLDLGNHVLKDLNIPQHIYQLRHPELSPQTFPALRTLSAHPNNLPLQPTPFVGREDELKEVAAYLQTPHCRLVTLLGMGGTGKTRLAIQAAAAQAEHYPHGVYFVPLAALATVEAIIPAIADAVGLRFYEREMPQMQLLNYLRDRTLLLVLDNLEHLMEGVEIVDRLLAHAPHVKILATSRERLNLSQEWVYEVQGMRVPASANAPDLETYSAIALFVQSALRVNPAFAVDESNRECIVRLCTGVSGLPLGIELAASWLRGLSCAEIVAEMERHLDFLHTTLRNIPERQRSLRAVFDYSWQLLTVEEQTALRCLSVFEGCFRREAAEAIIDELPAYQVLPMLTALVDKSLLYRRVSGAYQLHNLLRQYALEKLAQVTGLIAHARDRHCAYYAIFLEERDPPLRGPQPKEILDEIAENLGNIAAAWDWALRQNRLDDIERMISALGRFFVVRGHPQEGALLFDSALLALQKYPQSGKETLTFALLSAKLRACYHLRDLALVESIARQCWALAQDTNSRPHLARAKTMMGTAAWMKNDYVLGRRYFEEALADYAALANDRDSAGALGSLGKIAWATGDFAAAQEQFSRALDLWRSLNDLMGVADVLDNLGVTAREQGDLAKAQSYFTESHEIFQTLDAPVYLAYVSNHLAGAFWVNGDRPQAERFFRQAIAIGREIGEFRIVAYTLQDWGVELVAGDEFERALPMLEESRALFESLGEPFGLILVYQALGFFYLNRADDAARGRGYLHQALILAEETQNHRLLFEILSDYAQFLGRCREFVQAVTVLAFVQAQDIPAPFRAQEVWDALQSQLDAASFSAAVAHGRSLTFEALLAELRLE
ncbi:MAG: tetratricopeptide repeat protein [Anaerolineae bacterium]|nr:tetratricopeptide repeat protein [Anaerolineae bacterium]